MRIELGLSLIAAFVILGVTVISRSCTMALVAAWRKSFERPKDIVRREDKHQPKH